MKILVISRAFPPMIGGMSYSLKEFYEIFKSHHHKITIFIFPYNIKSTVKFPDNIINVITAKRYIPLNFLSIFKNLAKLLEKILISSYKLNKRVSMVLRFLRHIKQTINMMNLYELMKKYDDINNYDLVLAYRPDLSAQLGYLLKRERGKKFYVISHGMDILKKDILKDLVLKYADRCIVRSNYVKKVLINLYGINKEKISICTDGINPKLLKIDKSKDTLREKLNISQQDFCILSVGALYPPRKGFDLVLKSLKELRDKHNIDISNIKYILIGRDNPKIRKWLKNLAAKYNLIQNFKILVNLDNDLRNKYYKISDIFVMPSKDRENLSDIEGFGNVFIEASYFKLPNIGSNTGGIPDAIDNGKSGFLINCFEELVDKIKLFYENQNLRERMGNYAYDRVMKKFTMEKVYQSYKNVFKD